MFDFEKQIHRIRKVRKEKHLKRMADLELIEDKRIIFLQEKFQKDMMLIDKILNEIIECESFEQKSKKFMRLLNSIGVE